TSSMQLPYRRNLNQPVPSTMAFNQNLRPYPLFRNITYFDRGATQSYDSFQTEVRRRFSKGLLFTAHYTWAKNLTDSDDDSEFGGPIEKAFGRVREAGNGQYAPQPRVIAYSLWDVPVGHGRTFFSGANPVVDGFLGGWTFSTNVAAY